MAMYRVLHTLDVGKGRYLYPKTFSRLEWLNAQGIAALTEKGAVSRVNPPPIMILPGWTERAGELARIGIQDAEQFLEADVGILTGALSIEEDEVKELSAELIRWLTADAPAPG